MAMRPSIQEATKVSKSEYVQTLDRFKNIAVITNELKCKFTQ